MKYQSTISPGSLPYQDDCQNGRVQITTSQSHEKKYRMEEHYRKTSAQSENQASDVCKT